MIGIMLSRFEVVKGREVNVTNRRCGVHLTKEIHEISQNDVKGPGVMYTDIDDIEGLPSW